MSRREERRDSHHHSKRLTSRPDRDASPKRLRRDGKPVTERTSSKNLNLENSNATSPDRKHRRWFQDALLQETAVPPDSKSKQDLLDKGSEKKIEEPLDATRRASNPTEARSRSYFQHDERSSAGRGGRNFNRREHGRADLKDRSGDGTREASTGAQEVAETEGVQAHHEPSSRSVSAETGGRKERHEENTPRDEETTTNQHFSSSLVFEIGNGGCLN